MGSNTIETEDTGAPRRGGGASRERVQLVVAWCRDEPGRIGEVLGEPDAAASVFGRGERPGSYRQRPGRNEPAAPWASPRLSREQLRVRPGPDAVMVENLGRRELLRGRGPTPTVTLRPGEVVEVRNQLVLVAARRPAVLPRAAAAGPFGAPDADGLVGESPATWALRRRLDFVGRRAGHVLVLGPSGSGKELAAAALHTRRPGVWVARNAATLPPGLVDAELFGNVRNYPNPGTPERPGLIGAADGGTLFLDEFAELGADVQAHLLRVLDAGEYQRLGEAAPRRSRFRLLAATNRPVSALKFDVAARLPFTVEVPGLDARVEDIPLLTRHLLRGIAASDPELRRRWFGADGEARLAPGFVRALLEHRWTTHVRELLAWLWRALGAEEGEELDAGAPVPEGQAPGWEAWAGRPPAEIPAEVLQAALDACNGGVAEAARRLGLESRFVLSRLVRRHELVVRRAGGGPRPAGEP